MKVRYATCSFCFERQDLGGVPPGTRVACIKCGETFAVLDPRYTGRRGLLRRLAGLAGLAAGLALAAGVLFLSWGGRGLEERSFRPLPAAEAPPAVRDGRARSERLGYSFLLPDEGWQAAPADGPVQLALRSADGSALFTLAVTEVSPGAGLSDLRRASEKLSSDRIGRLLARASAQPWDVEAYGFARQGGNDILEFDFRRRGRSVRGDDLPGHGFLLPAGRRWYWFAITSPASTLPEAVRQGRQLMLGFRLEP